MYRQRGPPLCIYSSMNDETGDRAAVGPAPALSRPVGQPARLVTLWWPFVAALIIAGVGAAIGLETGIERLLDRWSYVWDYSHGYLVVLMSVWLVHNQLTKHPPEHISPSIVGVVTLAMTVLAYALVNVLDFTIAMQVLLPVMVAATVFACGGWQLGRLAVIPAAFL